MGTPAWIGLGSNLGDRKAHLDAAVAALSRTPGVNLRAVSSYHETAPVGGPGGQGAFLNAAAAVETTLEPLELLRALQKIEDDQGRVRSVRWGERTLDLDLLLFGAQVLDTPGLLVPHPRMAVRRFVLAPLAEIAPGAVDPVSSLTIAGLLANLDRRPSYVALHGGDHALRMFVRNGVAALLGAEALTGEEPPEPHADPVVQFLKDLTALARHLDAKRWPKERARDRWLVSGSCLPEHFRAWDWASTDARFREGGRAPWDRGRRRAWERYQAVRAAVRPLRPTFAVVLGADPERGPARADIPLIWAGSNDRAVLTGEVISSCLATRTG